MKDWKAIARNFRPFIEKLAKGIDDTEAIDHPEAFPLWKADEAYLKDDRVRYNDTLYKVLQPHTSQSDWTPDVAVSLFVRVDDPTIEFPEWIQPSGAHDAYSMGAKVSHNGLHWVSTVDNNVWEPGVYGWEEA